MEGILLVWRAEREGGREGEPHHSKEQAATVFAQSHVLLMYPGSVLFPPHFGMRLPESFSAAMHICTQQEYSVNTIS
jgi:hypothetical protein